MSKIIDLPTGQQERNKLLREISRRAECDAERRKTNAGLGGEWGDGGASDIRDALRIWQDGLAGRVPKELAGYAREAIKESHPDYPAFLRLKAEMERLGAKIGINDE